MNFKFLVLLFLLAPGHAALNARAERPSDGERLNVVLLVSDDQPCEFQFTFAKKVGPLAQMVSFISGRSTTSVPTHSLPANQRGQLDKTDFGVG